MKTKALTEANVELLCSYIKKTYTEASDFIDDNNVKTNGTYSSKKIEDVNESIRTELKKYADDLIGGVIRGIAIEIASEQPTLANTTPNKIYLYEIDNENHIYQQYLRTDTLLVNLGTTSINLSNYYTKDEIDNKRFLTEHQDISSKQDKLKIGTNITISDDNTISATGITVDNELSDTSENPIQNKVVKAALDAAYNPTNKDDLNKIGHDEKGNLTYNGKEIGTGDSGANIDYTDLITDDSVIDTTKTWNSSVLNKKFNNIKNKVNSISQADYNSLIEKGEVDSTVPYLVTTNESLGAEKKALLYYNNQLYNFANPSTESNEIQQKVSLNAAKNNSVEIATADSNNKLMIENYKFIKGRENTTSIIKKFNNSNKDNFIYNPDEIDFDDNNTCVKNKYVYDMKANSDGLYESEVINKNDFLEIKEVI